VRSAHFGKRGSQFVVIRTPVSVYPPACIPRRNGGISFVQGFAGERVLRAQSGGDLALVHRRIVRWTIEIHYIARVVSDQHRRAEFPHEAVQLGDVPVSIRQLEACVGHASALFLRQVSAVVRHADQ
jgi:hypothetical protein